jgi:hypothetical protein
MPDPDPSSLLGDILAASSTPRQPTAATRARTELEDLLRLGDADWNRFLMDVAPDDLVVVCKTIAPAWRDRVIASLDDVSRTWLRNNLDALDEPSPALVAEARARALEAAKRLVRDGAVTLPAGATPPAAAAAAPAAKAPPAPATAPAKPEPPPPAVHDVVNVSFESPKPKPKSKPAPAPAIGGVTMSFDAAPHSIPAAPAAPAASAAPAKPSAPAADDHGLDALFADLTRLRNQSGAAALAPLAADVPDPFLRTGLCLVAAGMPAADLERALDAALARQVESYLDGLERMRARLLALARGA